MSCPSSPVSSLRAHLVSSLLSLPGSRTFHLHVLVSTPRKPGQSLFLYARTRPKCLVQDILVLLSEQTTTHVEGCSSSIVPSASEGFNNFTPRTFVSAIEASVFAFPASDSTILYISKVDGTGQGIYPSPTSTILRAFLAFYASHQSPLYASPAVARHLWIHLFARSQRQYLFPNSADHPGKKPLSDVALCKWWKKVLSDVAGEVGRTSDTSAAVFDPLAPFIRLYYLLPGQTELEASYLLREPQSSSVRENLQWVYSHPYAGSGLTFPSGTTSTSLTQANEHLPLASLIPHFEDDPKSRFLDELAATSEEQAVAVPVPTPKRKRQKIGESNEDGNSTVRFEGTPGSIEVRQSDTVYEENETQLEMPAHFTELPPAPTIMFNPPSSSPAPIETHLSPLRPSTPEPRDIQHSPLLSPRTPSLPTFPASLLSPHTPLNYRGALDSQTSTPKISQTPRTPRRPKTDLDTVSPTEFWERMSFRQECAVGAVTGFFVAVFSRRSDKAPVEKLADPPPNSSHNEDTTNIPGTLLATGTIPHSVLKRIMSSLLTGVEFSTDERAHKGTQVMESAIKGLCEGLGQDKGSGDETDIYTSHVYAAVSVTNPPLVRKAAEGTGRVSTTVAAPVNVLGVRKKKKRQE